MTIKELRKSLGLSQPKLAKALAIGVSTVGAYEIGKIKPSQKVIDRIREVFNVDLSQAVEDAVDAVEPAPVEEKPAKKPAKPRKPVKATKAEKPAKEEEPAKKAARPVIIIQSPLGGEITAEEILAKTGNVDKVYVKVDENAAYWVDGDQSGAVNLW